MVDISFPESLPKVRVEQYSITPSSRIRRSNFTSGENKIRRVYSDIPDNFTVSWDLNQVELGILDAFYKYELEYGVQWFNFLYYSGVGDCIGVFRFVGQYSVSNIGPQDFIVSATIERRAEQVLSKSIYDDLKDLPPSQIKALVGYDFDKLHNYREGRFIEAFSIPDEEVL